MHIDQNVVILNTLSTPDENIPQKIPCYWSLKFFFEELGGGHVNGIQRTAGGNQGRPER